MHQRTLLIVKNAKRICHLVGRDQLVEGHLIGRVPVRKRRLSYTRSRRLSRFVRDARCNTIQVLMNSVKRQLSKDVDGASATVCRMPAVCESRVGRIHIILNAMRSGNMMSMKQNKTVLKMRALLWYEMLRHHYKT